MTEMRVVVGSGPGAVGVTHALLQRGFEVTMLDVGETLDAQTAKVVAAMAGQQPEQWSEQDRAIIQRVDFGTDPALPAKRLFGSAFSYFNDPGIEAPAALKLYGSRALGGLSTVWGCALLRATPAELQAWPGALSGEIAQAYLGIRDLLEPSIGADIFAAGTHLKISEAAQAAWDRYRASPLLHRDVSVYPTPLTISKACKACNACIYGCVYNYTYSSRTTIEDLFSRNPRFHYVGGMIVEEFSETAASVEIRAVDKGTGSRQTFNARQLFLAAGMMGSLRILWNSSPGVSRRLQARDSSLFLVPGLTFSGAWGGGAKHHGLSHLSVDLTAGPFAEKPAHVQLYFNNPAAADGLKARLGPLDSAPARKLVDIANRFVVTGQGYLHSDFCHRLELDCDDAGIIRASVLHNPATDGFIDAALAQFARQMRKLGIYFVNPVASITPYGASKTAGALPHAAEPDPSTTDQLGRPFGARNVFVVDMTVMPSIPARNHTLTMFANALRIGQSA
jgi:choline dehydrogenase-like flavoprotein